MIKTPEKDTEEDRKERTNLLEELEIKLEDLDKPMLLVQIGGQKPLIDTMLRSKYTEVQIKALMIFAAGAQNNAAIQFESIQMGAFQLFNLMLSDAQIRIKEYAASALSALVRGEFLEGKRIFIEMEGIDFCLKMIKESPSRKIQQKCISILKDLVLYDERLHFTHNDTSKFTNTNASKLHADKSAQGKESNEPKDPKDKYIPLSYDVNEELAKQNQLEKNAKYRDCVKSRLVSVGFVRQYHYLLDDIDIKNFDNRLGYLEIVLSIFRFRQETRLQKDSELFNSFKKFFEAILKQDQISQGANLQEIELLKQIMVLAA